MEAIFHIGIAQSVFTAFVLITRSKNLLPDKIMAAWMLAIAFELTHMLLQLNDHSLFRITSNFSFISLTFGPFLYIYVKKLLTGNGELYKADIIHFLPYLILTIIHLVFFTNRPMKGGGLMFDDAFVVFSFIKISALLVSLLYYSFRVINIILKHQKNLPDTYSYSSSKITLTWIKYISFVFIFTYYSLIIFFLIDLNIGFEFSSHYIPAFGLTLISFSLSYYGLVQPSLELDVAQPADSYEKGGKPTAEDMKYSLEKLIEEIKKKHIFLNPELTIQELSDQVNIPRIYMTKMINEGLNKNFFTFINEFRVEEARKRLADPDFFQETVLSIGLDSGFNSKSSFNALFKQNTGMTPSEYRKEKMNER